MNRPDFSDVRFEVVYTDIPDFPDERDLYVEVLVEESSLKISGSHHLTFEQSQDFVFSFDKEEIVKITAEFNPDPPRGTEPNWMHMHPQSTIDITLRDKYEVVDTLSISFGNHSSYWTKALLKEIESKLGIAAQVTDKTNSGSDS
jgi:hypothetical protein